MKRLALCLMLALAVPLSAGGPLQIASCAMAMRDMARSRMFFACRYAVPYSVTT